MSIFNFFKPKNNGVSYLLKRVMLQNPLKPVNFIYQGNIVGNGSFSKFAAPGLRMGWYELPARLFPLLEDSYFIESASGMGSYTTTIMSDVLESGLMDDHVQIVRKQFKVSVCLAMSGKPL